MNKGMIYLAAVLTVLGMVLTTMVQPAYFLANPSSLSLFSALVADRAATVDRDISFGTHPV